MTGSPGAPRRLRVAFIVILLLVTLLVVVVLALQAITTARYHRTTAEKVLRDYARLAAGQYANRASQDLYYNLVNPAIQRLSRFPGGRLPTLATLRAESRDQGIEIWRQIDGVFQLGQDGSIELDGSESLTGWRQWIRDTVPIHSKALAASAPFGGILRESEEPHFLAFGPSSGDSPVRGFLVPLDALEPILRSAAERGPLLPPSLTGGAELDSLVSVRVTSPSGRLLYQSAQFSSSYVAWDSTGDYVGRLPVFAALRPEIAGTLIIGGLPRSRLPLLLGLLVLTVALIVAALLLLRREQELSLLRAEFVSGVSHELRTPLAQIRMFAETLRLGRVRNEAERQRSLGIVDQEARRLTHLVENLLYFSRSERQPQRISPEAIELGPLVHDVVEGFASLASARGMRVEMISSANPPAAVDPDSVRQILLNLLDNAVKYGPPGQTITVTVGAMNGRASLQVEDHGPGIPEQDRERVWERFWRLPRDRNAGVAGTGIGLAIVRELAHMHGGRATVEAGSNGGARFVVLLGRIIETEVRT